MLCKNSKCRNEFTPTTPKQLFCCTRCCTVQTQRAHRKRLAKPCKGCGKPTNAASKRCRPCMNKHRCFISADMTLGEHYASLPFIKQNSLVKNTQIRSPWTQQSTPEWMPLVLLRATYGHSAKGKPGARYEYRILAGSAAGLQFETFWSLNFIKNLANRLGFRRNRRSRFKFTDVMEMVQMRLYMLFDPALTRENQPGAYKFFIPASFIAYNQRILKRRFRVVPCPLGLPLSTLRCHQCPVGYVPEPHKEGTLLLADGCYAACHPLGYYDKACPRCESICAPFDPLSKGVVCVDCEHKERRNQCSNTSKT